MERAGNVWVKMEAGGRRICWEGVMGGVTLVEEDGNLMEECKQ